MDTETVAFRGGCSRVPWRMSLYLRLWRRVGSGFRGPLTAQFAAYLCTCSHGRHGPAIGPQSEMRCWPLLSCLWRAIAPLMKPWCAEAEGADRCDSEHLSVRGIFLFLALSPLSLSLLFFDSSAHRLHLNLCTCSARVRNLPRAPVHGTSPCPVNTRGALSAKTIKP